MVIDMNKKDLNVGQKFLYTCKKLGQNKQPAIIIEKTAINDGTNMRFLIRPLDENGQPKEKGYYSYLNGTDWSCDEFNQYNYDNCDIRSLL